MVANETNQITDIQTSREITLTSGLTEDAVVLVIGRWMPIHNGHKSFLIQLTKSCHKVIVGIGSCYENGTSRNCIPAVEREKMLRAIFKKEAIPEESYDIVPIPDFSTFGEWLNVIKQLCILKGVTHFCSGNKEDILDELEKMGEDFPFEIINPETTSSIPYHATEIRKLIYQGNYEELEKMIPHEIKPILFKNTFKEIVASSRKRGIKIIPGRQTVDIIFLVRNLSDGKLYVLLGKRSMEKVDFPGFLGLPGGGIDLFETATDAVIREFQEETGLRLQMIDNSLEPAIVRCADIPNATLEQMHFIGIYSSEDEAMAGTRGGSSQCFGVFVEDDLEKYQDYLNPTDDLTDVCFYEVHDAISKGLAYQHGEMLEKAIAMFEASPKLVKPITSEDLGEKAETLVISFVGASGCGKSTAAFGTTYHMKKKGASVEYVPEFAKDLFYNGLLGKYIPNQSYIISEQYKRIYDLLGQVDFIVTDAGLEISALHASHESKEVEDLAWYLRNKTKQVTIFIERDEENIPFETKGRTESEAESRLFGIKLEEYMRNNHVSFFKVKGSDEAVDKALFVASQHLLGRLK